MLLFLSEIKHKEVKQLYSRQDCYFKNLHAHVVVISVGQKSQMLSHAHFLCVCAHTHILSPSPQILVPSFIQVKGLKKQTNHQTHKKKTPTKTKPTKQEEKD